MTTTSKMLNQEYDLYVSSTENGAYALVSGAMTVSFGYKVTEVSSPIYDSDYETSLLGTRKIGFSFEGEMLVDDTNALDATQQVVLTAALSTTRASQKLYWRYALKADPTGTYVQLPGYPMMKDFGGAVNKEAPFSFDVLPAGVPTYVGGIW